VPRAHAPPRPGGPAWAHAGEGGFIGAHATLATRGQARVENRIVFSGSEGAVIVSISAGALTVTDESGRVRADLVFPCEQPL
jgi:hypothetical protein